MPAERPPPPAGGAGRDLLAVLLLAAAGIGSLILGSFEAYASSGRSLAGAAELGMAGCALGSLVLILAPEPRPRLAPEETFGRSRAPRAGGIPDPTAFRPAHPVHSTPSIPRWADPMVHPKAGGASGPPPSPRPAVAVAAPAPLPEHRPRPPPPAPTPPRSRPPIREADLFAGLPDPDDRDDPWAARSPDAALAEGPAEDPREVFDELDRLEAELRALGPPAAVDRAATLVGVDARPE